MTDPYEAFWVHAPPDDPANYPRGLDVAFDWLAAPGHLGERVVVLYAAKMANNSGLRRANQFTVVSSRSRNVPFNDDIGAVLAIWPDPKTVEFAEDLAFGSALCVVPNHRHDMGWWIAKTNATNLDDPNATPIALTTITPTVAEALDEIVDYGGHNRFVGSGEKEYAVRVLRALLAQGHEPTPAEVEDYLRASGETNVDGARRLREWWEAILAGRQLRDYRGRSI